MIYKTNIMNSHSYTQLKSTSMSMTLLLISIFPMMLSFSQKEILIDLSMHSKQNLISLSFLFDKKSLMFSSSVALITSMVIFYSNFYMEKSMSQRFLMMILLFSSFMLILIFSGNLISMVIGWDGLGMMSFSLVFYYQNEISVKGSLITVFINRLGDSAIMMAMSLLLYKNKMLNSISILNENFMSIWLMLIITGGMTKSAQFPFMAWLPMAMSAPTPISSLVHSSTLVTAGIYLMIRINPFFLQKSFTTQSLSVTTMGVGALMAMSEKDFKKIVAFSTLSQMGLMFFMSSTGEIEMTFFHLLNHAIFKSFLFMLSGIFMMYSFGNQDYRIFSMKFTSSKVFQILTMFCCLNLSGFPMTLGFFSKDLMLENLTSMKFNSMILIFLISCSLTISYSIKMFLMIYKEFKMGEVTFPENKADTNKLILMVLMLEMVFFCSVLEENIVYSEIFSLSINSKILDLMIMVIPLILKVNLNFICYMYFNLKSILFYIGNLIFLSKILSLNSFFYLNSILLYLKFYLSNLNLISKLDFKNKDLIFPAYIIMIIMILY